MPLWAWLLLAFLVYASVQEYRLRALHAQLDAANLAELADEREAITDDLADLAADRDAALTSIEALRAESRRLEDRLKGLNADLGRQEAAGKRLVESGTVDETVAALRAAGLKSARPAR